MKHPQYDELWRIRVRRANAKIRLRKRPCRFCGEPHSVCGIVPHERACERRTARGRNA
jgi:hypothetical protein